MKLIFSLSFPLYKDIKQTYKNICNYSSIYNFLNQDNQNKVSDFIVQLNYVKNKHSNT